MSKRTKAALLLFALTLSVSALSIAQPQKQTVTYDGKPRTYYVAAPDKLSSPAPLLLLLHGSGRDGMSQIEQWKGLAEKEGLILVAPDSANSREWSMQSDGPEFLHQVLENVESKYQVDGKRVYLFGHSAGATFALYMAIMECRYFAAVGVHAGGIGEEFYPYLDQASRKIPVAIWAGDKDPYFTPQIVRSTRDALNARGFKAELNELKNHDHNYYAVAATLNPAIWDFLRKQTLPDDPEWTVYQR